MWQRSSNAAPSGPPPVRSSSSTRPAVQSRSNRAKETLRPRGLKSNTFKDWLPMLESLYPGRDYRGARGRGAIATTTPGLRFQSIRTPDGVQERLQTPRTFGLSPTHYRGRIQSFTRFPGWSSLSLLDPGLPSPIPAGIKNRTAGIQSLRHWNEVGAAAPRLTSRSAPEFGRVRCNTPAARHPSWLRTFGNRPFPGP